ncbi:MAG TPA: PA14 domain-containing protein, partial [Longimicrobiales bacterium]|nr:PA14 domain-containing protein [Longimicrobiales bacterium]
DKTYGDSGAGRVRKSNSGTYRYLIPDGGSFTFDTGGNLDTARPATTTPAYEGTVFDYVFDASQHLTKVTDALGRQVTFTWSGTPAHLTQIQAWDGRTWNLAYTSDRLAAVTNPEGETVEVDYDVGGRLSEVRDGRQAADQAQGWQVAYAPAAGDPDALERVQTVTPPGATDPWAFAYEGPFKGTTAARALVTDPRGVATASPADDYQTITDFNWAGLPIRVAGPADQNGDWPLTTQVWDAHNNLVCRRTPEANAVAEHCTATIGTEDPLSTVYAYGNLAPYRLESVTHPAPNPGGSGERNTESYAYDQGSEFHGLWQERFENPNLSGVPAWEGLNDQLERNWGSSGAPNGIDDPDFFSLRYTGYLNITASGPEKYKFKVYADDGVTLTVGDKTLLDCFGEVESYSDYNCGTNEVVKK